jgi:hypothetical protein
MDANHQKEIDRSVAYLLKWVNIFKNQGLPETSTELSAISNRLRKGSIPFQQKTILNLLYSVASAMKREFIGSQLLGVSYREECFEEMISTFDVIRNMGVVDFVKASEESFRYFSNRITNVIRNIRPFQEFHINFMQDLQKETASLTYGKNFVVCEDKGFGEKKALMFHFKAYLYLLMVEGVFDDLARIWYFLKSLAIDPKSAPKVEDLKRLTVDMILTKLDSRKRSVPVFLRNWEERKHWRNSIAHCMTDFDLRLNTLHFVDFNCYSGKITYDEFVTWFDFQTVCLELEDTLRAFDLAVKVISISAELGKIKPSMPSS